MPTRELLVKVLLWYNVLSFGIWFGGTLYQMLVIVPLWSASPPESVRAFFRGTGYLTTIGHFFGPVTQAARALPLFLLAGVAWRYDGLRSWVGLAAFTMLLGVVVTRSYIYPMNDVLFTHAGGELTPGAIQQLARRWILADRLRFLVMGAGYLCLLHAFSLPSADWLR